MSLRGLKVRLERLEESRNDELRQEMLRPFPKWLEPEVQRLGWASETSSAPLTEWKYDALPAQLAFHTDLRTPFKGYSGPIGSGKSHALVYEALLLSRLNPGLLGLVGAPTYRMLEDSTQRTFFEVLEAEGIGYDFNKQDNRLRFAANGSEILFRTMENPDRLKDSYAELVYRQEVLGEYLDIYGGNAYYAFSDENVEPAKYNPNLALYWALDFNVDRMSSVICQLEEWKRRPWSQASYECKKTLRVL